MHSNTRIARGPSALSTSNGQQRQRFTRGTTCPVCGGCEKDQRGESRRCFGYISGNWIHCTREDHSAGCEFNANSSTYSHRLKGACPCGTEHNPADPPAAKTPRQLGEIERVYKYHDAQGVVVFEVVRLKNPKDFRQRKPGQKKGWSIDGVKTVLYHLPLILAADPDQPVWIVEGEKDVDNLGAMGRLATCNPMGAGKWRDHYADSLVDRHCVIIPDNDKKGREHAQQVAQSLHGKAASVKVVELPGLPDRGDVSDFLDRGGTVDQLDELARGTSRWKPTAENERSGERFANFTARIVREIVRHESGGDTTRHVEVEAKHDDGTVATATVAAEDFESMSWVSPQLGLKFVIDSGRSVKDQFRHSIQVNSFRQPVESREVFTSLGWQTVGGKDVYLHAGGAIGGNGETDIRVDVSSELGLYCLPPPDVKCLRQGTERVLAILDSLGVEAEPIAAIVVSLPFRALLGPSRTVPHFAGTTGTLKTSTACLALRFFAPALEFFDSMPLSWQSTQAGLERLRYVAKDSLVVIDNLIADGEQAHRDLAKADSVINSQGDLAGKARMKADGSPAPRLDPRGCIISTGECEPRRKSSTGRSIIQEFKPGMVNLDGLKRCHDDARAGWYALTIACYAQHLAFPGRLEEHRTELRRRTEEHQAAAMKQYQGCHLRQAEAVAEWTAGLQLFLRFAVEHRAIDKVDAELFVNRVREQLFRMLPMQADIQDEADPGEMFIKLLRALLASKRAVLSNLDGLAPEPEPAKCGWSRSEVAARVDTGLHVVPSWDLAPGAARIGWIDDGMVYLDPDASYAAVERMARETGQVVGSKRQVCARLADSGWIQIDPAVEGRRRRFTKRFSVEKHRHEVLWMPVDVLFLPKS